MLKNIADILSEPLSYLINSCFKVGHFPNNLKLSRVVPVHKSGSIDDINNFRPISLVPIVAKVIEGIMYKQMQAFVESNCILSKRQYGFIRGQGTINAITDFMKSGYEALNNGDSLVVKLLDLSKAFDTVSHDILVKKLAWYGFDETAIKCISSYLSERLMTVHKGNAYSSLLSLNQGVPQGSILGPLFFVLYINDLPASLDFDGVDVYLFADDLAVQLRNADSAAVTRCISVILRAVTTLMESRGLSLASEKTELVLLTRRHLPTEVPFSVGAEEIVASRALKYLWVYLDTKLSFWEQVRRAVEKAGKITSALSRLMANVGGPTECRRRLLMTVTNSVLLYGAEVWAGALDKGKYRKQKAAVQRRGALRIASAYRTVSEPAVLVIAGVPPIDLLALERRRVHRTRREVGVLQAKVAARAALMESWEERWRRETRGRWTARLIPSVEEWVSREWGEVGYYLTQFLSGHGYFRAYLQRMGIVEDAACIYGDSSHDDACHTFFECDRWSGERAALERVLGTWTPERAVAAMCGSRQGWGTVARYVEGVLKSKKRDLDRVEGGR
ncbi:hypothetical protein O3M35_004114 [Rhynocoris fuscipes]|uniref:Reverse transcriptase domain-containing protein n=1 Tax=Rhynocoris fuscipes TaxID=488301 RepID=A0AAW1CGH4_9HEMI